MLSKKIEKRNISGIQGYGLFAKELILKDKEIGHETDDTVKTTSIEDFKQFPETMLKSIATHRFLIL